MGTLISTVKKIDYSKKFGYIKGKRGEKDYGFNTEETNFISISFEELKEGDKVSFILEKNNKGYIYATNIQLVIDEKLDTNTSKDIENELSYLEPGNNFTDSELIIGMVSPVGVNSSQISETLKNRLKNFKYDVEVIKVSSLLPSFEGNNENDRINHFINAGDLYRSQYGNDILAKGVVTEIRKIRDNKNKSKNIAYIIDSLKHPSEVELLRKVYNNGFYLLGIHANQKQRQQYLEQERQCTEEEAKILIKRDENEESKSGQKTRDTYHLADFFINFGVNTTKINNTIQRFLDLIFSDPYKNPTFDEFAMFMAFNSSVRSADLSRQVGAVLSKDKHILSTGANDVPQFSGGLYWAEVNNKDGSILDKEQGKDYKRKQDPNKKIQDDLIKEIIDKMSSILDKTQETRLEKTLKNSLISDLTEFGRVVHAEMEAILACGRNGIPTKDTILYCTTFPCHNCAKHIVASGVKRVIYVEPYPKSKALELHNDSIMLVSELDDNKDNKEQDKVLFEPFIGVGPRRFLDLFSMSLGLGTKLIRKDKNNGGTTFEWSPSSNYAKIRTPLSPKSYLEIENDAIMIWKNKTQKD